ncbi:Digeranylgeranylglycerophospholipid reductase [uncultured archaeon]|nr:Digeranylgeranylglycerophospholipid reductase [uncultured archaeon]
MKTDYDIIVAGGGLAGMISAQSIAYYSNQRLSVLVIDRNPEPTLGKKTINGWICGDAVGKNTVDYMTERIKIRWGNPEIEHPVKGVMAFSPDRETSIPFDGDGYMLNRQQLPKSQLRDAKKMGVNMQYSVALRNLSYEDGTVVGVEGTNLITNEPFKKTSKIVIDASGVTSMLRNGLSINSKIEKKIDRDDLESTGRHIMKFEQGIENKTDFDSDYCIIHLDQDIAPGGYGWVFPKGKDKVNIGLGVQQKELQKRNQRLGMKDDVTKLINDYVKMNKVMKNPRLSDDPSDSVNVTGNWQVSVRRQNDCLVANGYMLVGDAAWMPKPLDAGGIGPAIVAATIIGKNAVEAIESGDVSERGLWKYNMDFINDYGYKTAGLEIFRRLLQTLTNEQINYGMKHFLSKLDVEAISKGEHPDFGTVEKLGMMIRGALNKKLADGLRFTAQQNKLLTEHYYNFPETPDGYHAWHKTLHQILDESYARLGN